MITAKILAIIAVIVSALLTIKQQQNVPSDALHVVTPDATDVSFNFSHYDFNKILESYGR